MKRRRNHNINKVNYKINIKLRHGSVFILVLLAVANIVAAISTSTKSVEVVTLEEKIKAVESETSILKGRIVKESSLTDLAENIEELKLQKPENFIYLNSSDYYAKMP